MGTGEVVVVAMAVVVVVVVVGLHLDARCADRSSPCQISIRKRGHRALTSASQTQTQISPSASLALDLFPPINISIAPTALGPNCPNCPNDYLTGA